MRDLSVLAVGVLVTSGLHGVGYTPGPYDAPVPYQEGYFGTMGITRLGPQLARASERPGVPLELVTAG